MAGDVQTEPRSRMRLLSSGGQRHTIFNLVSILVLVVGLVSFVLGLVVRNAHTGAPVHVIATATGLFSILVGLYLQMISSTREQRVLIVTGMIAGFVGLAIGLSKGGFLG